MKALKQKVQQKSRCTRRARKEYGAVMIETILILPFWLFCGFSMIDIYYMLRTRGIIAHVAREAVIASAVLQVTDASATTHSSANYFDEFQGCLSNAAGAIGIDDRCARVITAARARLILNSMQRFSFLKPEDVEISVETSNGNIAVTVSAIYQSRIAKYFFGKKISVTESGPANIHNEMVAVDIINTQANP